MKVDFLDITSAKIRPRLGWGNSPDIELLSSEPLHSDDEIYHYNEEERIYWCQMEDGFTSFLYASKPLYFLQDDKRGAHWKTLNNGRYYGRTFKKKVHWQGKVIPVDIVGPWSGGCYIANKVLPKPACEVTINNCHGINFTIERIRLIIEEFNLSHWTIELDGSLGMLSPEFRYKGLLKKEWTDSIKEELWELNLDGYSDDVKKRMGV